MGMICLKDLVHTAFFFDHVSDFDIGAVGFDSAVLSGGPRSAKEEVSGGGGWPCVAPVIDVSETGGRRQRKVSDSGNASA